MTEEYNNYKGTAFKLSSFFFLHYATLGVIFPFMGYFFKESGFSGTEIGLYMSIFPAAKFLVTNLWTLIFSKIRHKKIYIGTCILISSVSLIPLIYTTDRFIVAVIMVIFASTRTGVIPVMDSIAISMDSVIAYGRLRLFGSVGFIITSIISGIMVDNLGLSGFIWTFTGAGILAALPAIALDYSSETFTPTKRSERKLTPELIIFFTGVTVYLASYSFLYNFFNITVSEAGYSQSWAGYMWAIGVLSEIFFLYNQDKVLKLFNVKTLIALSMLLAGVRYVVTGYSDSLWMLALFSTMNGFAYGTFHLGVMRYIRLHVPQRLKLKAQGIYSGVGFGLGSITGSALSGLTYDISGLTSVWMLAFGLSTAGAVIIYFFTGRKKLSEYTV
ncbi:major facilitator superfamily MFS_1 [Denitrovibrio acetiphilus DSM 12809]|uniref:Major facilitator superfamily MFS_1 n=1 Tax=Denitrovibrio acetiphilus (strain DSM 12809 / NBRC 114555 / N2460) TaxID=522772 RepID=D4H3R1_DENA2|nr:MFS transporter [Denitrovibrio acetiphilus]ADD69163.1 major facilitator superfamily MFS_1 [Denitrovibrio acetiphilus DSM 12809]